MKKTNRRLDLNRITVRPLVVTDLKAVQGGVAVKPCTHNISGCEEIATGTC